MTATTKPTTDLATKSSDKSVSDAWELAEIGRLVGPSMSKWPALAGVERMVRERDASVAALDAVARRGVELELAIDAVARASLPGESPLTTVQRIAAGARSLERLQEAEHAAGRSRASKPRAGAFLSELLALCARYEVALEGCGCMGAPWESAGAWFDTFEVNGLTGFAEIDDGTTTHTLPCEAAA